MPPVLSTGLNLDDDQRFALMKFRRSVNDVCTKPEHSDYFLLRWLKARSWNAEAAEKMLRDSMAWREKWGIDTQLPSWVPPEPLLKFFPSGLSGFDKGGSPVMILPFAELDLWGILHAVSKGDMIRMVIREIEAYLKFGEEQSVKYGSPAKQLVCIMDMEGFSMKQYTWRPAGELVISLLQMYESNYPEILKICYIINAPKVFSLAFAIVKKFVHEMTIRKIEIYNSDQKKWEAAILKTVDRDQLPKHYGGTMVDPDGDPRCPSKIKRGGKVPKSYFIKKINEDEKSQFTSVTVKKGDKHLVHLISDDPGCFLKWDLKVEEHDIKFSIVSLDTDGNESVVIGPKKVSGNSIENGVISANSPATYTMVFDNTSSYLRSKQIYYNVGISPPLSNLDINTTPDDSEEDNKTIITQL